MELDKKLQNIIIGSVLGDGSFEKKPDTLGVRLQIKQQSKAKECVDWLYDNFELYCNSGVKYRKDYNQYYFSTKYAREFRNLFDNFYKKGKKIIPDNINKLLTSPMSLAIWYMDDGSLDFRLKSHYAFYLSTDCFELGDTKKLQKLLFDNFGVVPSVYNNLCRGKRYTRIFIGKQGRD